MAQNDLAYMDTHKVESIARLIKHNRIRLNYTQKHLSDISGISLRSLQRIEKAQVIPRASTLNLLVKHLEVELPGEKAEGILSDRNLSKNFKLVLSILLAVIVICLALAFVFQSPTFPESAFELSLFMAGGFAIYSVILFLIWRR